MSSKKEETKKSIRSFGNKLFNGRASTTKKTLESASKAISPHENPAVSSAPPSRSTSQFFNESKEQQRQEEIKQKLEELAVQEVDESLTSLKHSIAEKWASHRVDFASRCTIHTKSEVNTTHWNEINASLFNVRTGPNYKKNKKKAPSLNNLYDIVCVRCFKSKRRTMNIVNVLPLPIDDLYHGEIGNEMKNMTSMPQALVVHFWLPNETPNMFNKKEDGTGSEVIFYLRPSSKLLQEISSSPSPATSLFQKWYETCTIDEKLRKRFKCMGVVQNLNQLNMKWLEPYNGKPTLITDSGSVRKGIKDGVSFLEMSVNVHAWAFLAKKSFVSLLPKFKEMKINVGFTIEALEDEEMPECILGCVSMNYIDESMLLTIPTDMQS